MEELDDIIAVDDGDAIIMAQKLSRIRSGGRDFIRGQLYRCHHRPGFIGRPQSLSGRHRLADDNKKYLSTDYIKEEKVKSEFLSKDVKLLDFEVRKLWKTMNKESR